jgi:hypothetical protein
VELACGVLTAFKCSSRVPSSDAVESARVEARLTLGREYTVLESKELLNEELDFDGGLEFSWPMRL